MIERTSRRDRTVGSDDPIRVLPEGSEGNDRDLASQKRRAGPRVWRDTRAATNDKPRIAEMNLRYEGLLSMRRFNRLADRAFDTSARGQCAGRVATRSS